MIGDYSQNTLNESLCHHRKEAFSKLYDRYSRLVLGYIYTIIKDEQAAEEILQKVFIMTWDDFKNNSGFKGRWFLRLMNIVNQEIPGHRDIKLQWLQEWRLLKEQGN